MTQQCPFTLGLQRDGSQLILFKDQAEWDRFIEAARKITGNPHMGPTVEFPDEGGATLAIVSGLTTNDGYDYHLRVAFAVGLHIDPKFDTSTQTAELPWEGWSKNPNKSQIFSWHEAEKVAA